MLSSHVKKWISSIDLHPMEPTDLHPMEPTDLHPMEPTDLHPMEPTDLPTLEPTDLHPMEPTDLHTMEPTDLHTMEPTDLFNSSSKSRGSYNFQLGVKLLFSNLKVSALDIALNRSKLTILHTVPAWDYTFSVKCVDKYSTNRMTKIVKSHN